MSHDLTGQVAIITGAGKGLGRAYALHLARRGAAVVVNNRRHEGQSEEETSAAAVVQAIRDAGGRAVANHDDVGVPAAGQRLVDQALAAFGRLDIVITNAGIDRAAAFHKLGLETFREVFDISFFGTLHLIHAAWPVLRQQRYGRLVLTTSTAGLHGNAGQTAYSSAKAAIIGLVNALSHEAAHAGDVAVNAIAPFAHSQMTGGYLSEEQSRLLQADRVAPVVGWLASPACTSSGGIYISGAGVVRRALNVQTPCVEVPEGGSLADLPHHPLHHYEASHQSFLDLMAMAAERDRAPR